MSIENKLREAKQAYYNDGTSNLSDAEYDILEDELRQIDPDNELLKEVGSEPVSSWPKANHEIPMGSLDKVQDTEQFYNWITKCNIHNNELVMVVEKLDGISIAIRYTNGKFSRAITRGDGSIGEDISQNVIKMKNVPQSLPTSFNGWLRGEIILYKEDWKKFLSEKKNPRNAAAGTSKRLDGIGCEHLTVLFYDVVNFGNSNNLDTNFTDRHAELNFISKVLDLTTAQFIGPIGAKEVPNLVSVFEGQRNSIPYDIDGLVVDINNLVTSNALGVLNMRPRGSVAYKFKPEQKKTTITNIIWQIGRTGRLTPVAELKPVDIGGVTISRVSLHTAKMAISLKAGPGASVIISRRNDVIPYVESVLTEAEVPLPTIEHKWDGDYLIAMQLTDKESLYNAVKVWVQRLRILHWGDALISMLIDYKLINELSDIYTIDWNIASDIVGDGIAKRARESLDSKKDMDFATFLSALNIRYCNQVAKNIVTSGIDTVEKLIKSTEDQFIAIDGIGKTKAHEIRKSIVQLERTILNTFKHISITTNTGKLAGVSFCFTGSMSRQRKELESIATSIGADVKSSVTKGLTYLVMANPESITTKANKARELGTKCISEEQFIQITSAAKF